MLFEELKRLATSPKLAGVLTPEGFARKRVRYLVKLDFRGKFLGLIDLGSGTSPQERRGLEMVVPNAVRSSGTRPLLLADGPDYVYGIDADPGKMSRAARRRVAFAELVQDCAVQTESPEVRAVDSYLSAASPPPGLDPAAGLLTFEVGGSRVVDLPEVRRYWAARERGSITSSEVQCLVCGRRQPCVDVWPVPIKGIPGGKTSGNQLVSANANAFESYGLDRSRTSPACLDCAADIGKALNWLIKSDAHHFRAPNEIFVFWTRDGDADFNPGRMLSDPDPAEVRELLRAPLTGAAGAVQIHAPDFFAVALSASGSRVVVRSWIETTVETARRNLAQYFQNQAVVQWDGGAPGPLSIARLVRATARDLRTAHPFAAQDLVELALENRPAPPRLLAGAVTRSQLEHRVTTARAALFRIALLTTPWRDQKEEFMSELDVGNPSPAYICGRLLAELEAVQRAAQGSATLVDRYYGSASSSPGTVFGPLLRNAQYHLAKLRRDRPGVYRALDRRITDILQSLTAGFPPLLTVREQAVFGLGYYQQKAHDRAAARVRRELAETTDLQEEGQDQE